MGRNDDAENEGARPALARALEVGARAAEAGFDWPDARGPLEKLREELAELEAAVRGRDPSEMEAELGDLLFAAVNLARHLRLDPERALAGTLHRFETRFAFVASSLARDGLSLGAVSLDELERRWREAKRRLE
jgi:ATP diphosphatase